jgi:predicted dehydrogenase/dTDP-4-amino-4,6-dideoxygalactose transaminase
MTGHAIVGCGRIAVCHADAFARVGTLAACADLVGGRAADLAARFGIRAAADVDELLDDASVVSLSICTPHDVHGDIALHAVERGKHVLVEKPLVLDLAHGERLLARARERGVVVMPVVQHRFDPIVRAVMALVRSGDLGPPRLVRAHLECARPAEYYRDSGWRGLWPREGGSVVMNQAYHAIDLLLALCGDVDRAGAEMTTFAPADVMQTEDSFAAALRFASGALGTVSVTGAAGSPWNSYIEILGAWGEIAFTINYPQTVQRLRVADRQAMLRWKKTFTAAAEPALEAPPAGAEYYGISHRAQALAFDARIRGETPEDGAATAADALATVALIQRLYAAAGKPEPRKARAAAAPAAGAWHDRWVDVTEDDAAKVAALLQSGQTSVVAGGILERFEREFAEFCGRPHAVAFSSGTGAIYTALRALGVGAGDDVLVSDYAFHAVASAIFALGAHLVPCDIDPQTLTLDPADIHRKRTPRSKAVVVHCPWGVPPYADAIRAAAGDLPILFDGSHAHGAMIDGRPLAQFADVACYSLGRQKFVSGGELGAAVTADVALRDQMLIYAHVNRVPAALRASSWRGNAVGLKFRPHPAALSLALSQLARIDEKLRRSRETCRRVEAIFESCGFLPQRSPSGATRSYWRIVLRLDERWDSLQAQDVEAVLRATSVPVEPNHYWPLLQEQDACRWPAHERLVVRAPTPVAHRVVPRTITLPAPVALAEEAFAAMRAAAEALLSRSAISASQ